MSMPIGSNTIGRVVLDCIMHKLPSARKYYRVSLIVPDNGIPTIEYHQARGSLGKKRVRKTIHFLDLWYADKKHDTNDKNAFSIYTIDKTVTFLAQDETTMNEWLTKIREYHSNLYPELTQYDAIFEATLLDKGLAKTMNLQGLYRLALCKESLDLVPLLTPQMIEQLQQQQQQKSSSQKQTNSNSSSTSSKQFKLPSALTHLHYHSQSQNHSSNKTHHHHHHHHHNHDFHLTPQTLIDNNTQLLEAKNSSTLKMTTDTNSDGDFMLLDTNHQHASSLNAQTKNTPNPLHNPHLPRNIPSNQRFSKRHPWVTQKTIQLARRSIRRCGHTDSNFYIESGRHSTIGEGDLWFALNKKSTARHLHELLLATIMSQVSSQADDQFLCKAPRSRSGSSSENALFRSQQSRSSSLMCLNNNQTTNNNNNNNTQNSCNQQATLISHDNVSGFAVSTNQFSNGDEMDEDGGYLPMA